MMWLKNLSHTFCKHLRRAHSNLRRLFFFLFSRSNGSKLYTCDQSEAVERCLQFFHYSCGYLFCVCSYLPSSSSHCVGARTGHYFGYQAREFTKLGRIVLSKIKALGTLISIEVFSGTKCICTTRPRYVAGLPHPKNKSTRCVFKSRASRGL